MSLCYGKVNMLTYCQVSAAKYSYFLHHLGLIKDYIMCEKKNMERTGILRLRKRLGFFGLFWSTITNTFRGVIQIYGLMIYSAQSESTRFFIEHKF